MWFVNIFYIAGPPDTPSVYIQQEDWSHMNHEVYILDDNSTLEISWDRPEDNGAKIDFYRNSCIDIMHLCKRIDCRGEEINNSTFL